jgi:tRNA threonylcarbamoyladenosine modification (KEOPS) complex Cgi121 subunit
MMKNIEGFNRYVAIVGFKDVKIKDANSLLSLVRERTEDAEVQFFNAELIAGWEHLYFAVLNALKAFESRLNISNSLAIEILLYASARRQIKRAVELLGITSSSSNIAAVILAETESKANKALETVSHVMLGKRDDNVIELSNEKFDIIKNLFNISEAELNAKLERKGMEKKALTDLVIEHVALLAIQR